MIDKPGEAKLKIIATEKLIERKLFTVRRASKMIITPLAILLAKAAAEDANTAYYVQEYNKGHLSSRADYIEYMADKFQFLMNGGKL